MYTYTAGSPKTFNGYASYLQEGHPLSYAPRFNGYGAPRPIDVMGPGYGSAYYAAGSPGGYRGYGQTTAPATTQQQSGGGWADAINAAITGVAAIWQMDTQRRIIKQQQHQAERDAAAQRELARTQALYLQSQSIKPAQGSHVTVAVPPGHAKRGMGTMMMVGGLAVAGGVAWMMFGRRRRR